MSKLVSRLCTWQNYLQMNRLPSGGPDLKAPLCVCVRVCVTRWSGNDAAIQEVVGDFHSSMYFLPKSYFCRHLNFNRSKSSCKQSEGCKCYFLLSSFPFLLSFIFPILFLCFFLYFLPSVFTFLSFMPFSHLGFSFYPCFLHPSFLLSFFPSFFLSCPRHI